MIKSASKPNRRQYYTRYLGHYTRKNYAIIGLGLLLLSGVFLGAILLARSGGEVREFLESLMTKVVYRRPEQPVASTFASAAGSSLTYISLLFVCGFCAIGQPLELALPFLRGLGYGFSAACLYSIHGSSAAGYICLYLLPNMAISAAAIMFCSREALRMSTSIGRSMTVSRRHGGDDRHEPYSLRIYMARFLVAAIICAISAVIEAFTFYSFANSINLM